MNKSHRRVSALMLLIAWLAMPTMAVLAKELSSLTVTGPGIQGEVTLKGPDEMMKLMEAGFFDTYAEARTSAPENSGEPYTILAYLDLEGKIVPFVRMDYYPARPGEHGYVHTTGRGEGASFRSVDEWSTLPARAETVFRDLMMAQGVTLQSAVSIPAPAVVAAELAPAEAAPAAEARPADARPAPTLYAALAAAILALAGAGLLRARKLRESR